MEDPKLILAAIGEVTVKTVRGLDDLIREIEEAKEEVKKSSDLLLDNAEAYLRLVTEALEFRSAVRKRIEDAVRGKPRGP